MSNALGDRFAQIVRRYRDRPAIYAPTENQCLTFGDLLNLQTDIDASLDALLAAHEGAIVSNVGNLAAFVPLVLAGIARRRPLVLLDGSMGLEYAQTIARRFGASIVVAPLRREVAESGATPLPGGLAALPAVDGNEPCIDESAAIVKMTSGSSAVPKGVLVTEQALINDADQIIEAMALRPDDVNVALVPLAHSYGFSNLVLPLLLQGTAMVLRAGFLARLLLDDVNRFGATVLPGVPFIFDYLARLDGDVDAMSRVRLEISAGAPLEYRTAKAYARRFGRTIHSFYGTSETGGIAYDACDDLSDPITVGRPLPRTAVTLLPAPNANGGTGRVFVTGNALGFGYAGDSTASDGGEFTNGGFLTADLARWRDDGSLMLTGRLSRFVNIAGRKVHSAEIERVIAEATGASGVMVVGVPWPSRGEAIVACVRNADGDLSAEAVRARCVERLPAYMVPRSVLLLDEFPVDVRGKVDRTALLRLAVASVERS